MGPLLRQRDHRDRGRADRTEPGTGLKPRLLRAELGILLRRNHSYVVSYVDASMDAMVYAKGGSDFIAQNTTSDYVFLDAYVNTANCTVTVNVIGREEHSASHSVRFETNILSLESPGVNNVVDTSLPMGWVDASEKIIFPESLFMEPILESVSYKIVTDNGVSTRTQLNHDRYKGYTPTVSVAPDVRWILKTTTDRNRNYLISNMSFIDSNQTDIGEARRLISENKMGQFNREMRALFPGTWTAKDNQVQGRVMYGEAGTDFPTETESESETETESETAPDNTTPGSETTTAAPETTTQPTAPPETTTQPTDPPETTTQPPEPPETTTQPPEPPVETMEPVNP